MKSENEMNEKPPAEWLQGVVIRAADPQDAEAIAALHNLAGYRHGTLRTPFHAAAEIRRHLEGRRAMAGAFWPSLTVR